MMQYMYCKVVQGECGIELLQLVRLEIVPDQWEEVFYWPTADPVYPGTRIADPRLQVILCCTHTVYETTCMDSNGLNARQTATWMSYCGDCLRLRGIHVRCTLFHVLEMYSPFVNTARLYIWLCVCNKRSELFQLSFSLHALWYVFSGDPELDQFHFEICKINWKCTVLLSTPLACIYV